jgi:hypothetical protein
MNNSANFVRMAADERSSSESCEAWRESARQEISRTKRMSQSIKFALRVVAVFFIVIGTIWILQGINILPGSFMTGQIQWAYRGGIAAVVGVVLLLVTRRRR